jgi:predicted RNA-binding Zn-ribbon protein involved in translation (DUF1610 family)
MPQSEESKLFNCPKCGSSGTIIFLKAVGKKIFIKQKCPKHGVRSFKIPLMTKNLYIPHIRDNVFQCPYCGKDTTVESAKPTGPWMLVKCVCPTHGNKLLLQRIWSTIYVDISSIEAPTPQVLEQKADPINKKKYCPNCGTPITGDGKYCDTCGAEVAQVEN